MKQKKYLEYYMDSKEYSNEEIQKRIDETKKDFLNKKVDISICLNDFGVYVITFKFETKETFFDKIKIILRRKNILLLSSNNKKNNKNRLEKYYGENRYGKYKDTGIYRPY